MESITREELSKALQYWTADVVANPENFTENRDENYGNDSADYIFGLIEDDKV